MTRTIVTDVVRCLMFMSVLWKQFEYVLINIVMEYKVWTAKQLWLHWMSAFAACALKQLFISVKNYDFKWMTQTGIFQKRLCNLSQLTQSLLEDPSLVIHLKS